MANEKNFSSDFTTLTEQYNKFTVSRVVANKEDDLLSMEVSADFPQRILSNNVEVHLYSLANNSLVFSNIVKNTSDVIYTKKIQYSDDRIITFLFIDFTKIDAVVPEGRYSVTLNFFSDDLGSDENKILKVTKISNSRTEVELKLTDQTKQSNLENFAKPSINKEYILLALKQIFNQTGSGEITLPMSSVKIDSSSLYQNFTSGSGEKLIQYGFTVDDGSRIGIDTIAQNVLNVAYPIAETTIKTLILSGSNNFTETDLTDIVVNAIDTAYDTALNDEALNPQNYRFDLI